MSEEREIRARDIQAIYKISRETARTRIKAVRDGLNIVGRKPTLREYKEFHKL